MNEKWSTILFFIPFIYCNRCSAYTTLIQRWKTSDRFSATNDYTNREKKLNERKLFSEINTTEAKEPHAWCIILILVFEFYTFRFVFSLDSFSYKLILHYQVERKLFFIKQKKNKKSLWRHRVDMIKSYTSLVDTFFSSSFQPMCHIQLVLL